MNSLKETADPWFSEIHEFWPGLCLSFQVRPEQDHGVLYDAHSQFQHIQVLSTPASSPLGKVLVLDGAVQLTEMDEFAYHEMMAHVPLHAHPRPERVLVIGGGDGGVVREVCKHASVLEIVLCELDEMVIDVSKKFFPAVSSALSSDPRVRIETVDGAEFAKRHTDYFDIVIVDCSDPVGPASVLYSTEFYSSLRRCLRKNGLVVCQGESMWLHRPFIRQVIGQAADAGFCHQEYASIGIPTYPGGQIGMLIFSEDRAISARQPHPAAAIPSLASASCRYYSAEMHTAAFALPPMVQRDLFPDRFPRQ